MNSYHRSAAAVAALLLLAAPAAAIDISPAPFQLMGEADLHLDAPLVEFDVDDWATFIGGDAPEYRLPVLGTGFDFLGGRTASRTSVRTGDVDERRLTQVWEGP